MDGRDSSSPATAEREDEEVVRGVKHSAGLHHQLRPSARYGSVDELAQLQAVRTLWLGIGRASYQYSLAFISHLAPPLGHFENALPVLIGDRALRDFFAGRRAFAIVFGGVHFGP